MSFLTPWKIILLAFFLLLLGVILPFLMVMRIIESTFFLNFFSYTSSLIGLLLGLIGVVQIVRVNKK